MSQRSASVALSWLDRLRPDIRWATPPASLSVEQRDIVDLAQAAFHLYEWEWCDKPIEEWQWPFDQLGAKPGPGSYLKFLKHHEPWNVLLREAAQLAFYDDKPPTKATQENPS